MASFEYVELDSYQLINFANGSTIDTYTVTPALTAIVDIGPALTYLASQGWGLGYYGQSAGKGIYILTNPPLTSATTVLPVSAGGTGVTAATLTAGNTGIIITGNWPNQIIYNAGSGSGGGSSTLIGLSDVSIVENSSVNNTLLYYNNSTSKWNQTNHPIVSAITATQALTAGSNTAPFTYGTLSYSDTGLIGIYSANANSYIQSIIQNQNSGSSASTDYIVSNNLGDSGGHYGDFGINSSGFSGSGSLNIANATYLYAENGDLSIGTGTANAIHFVINNSSTDAAYIDTSGNFYTYNNYYGTTGTFTGALTAVSLGLNTPLPISSGGTGTSSPGLISGTNINVSGSWPNQTIAFNGTLPVTSGGTGSNTQNFVDLSTNQTINGGKTFTQTVSAANIYITAGTITGASDLSITAGNTNIAGSSITGVNATFTGTVSGGTVNVGTLNANSISSTNALPVTAGGTGTSSPGLISGTNINVSGNWPNQTIAFNGTLPVSSGGTGITSFGTGVATALGQNVSGSGNIVLSNSATLTGASFVNPTISNYQNFTGQSSAPSATPGTVWYDSTNNVLAYYNNTNSEILIGKEVFVEVYNNTGSQIPGGTAVYINGANGTLPTITLAQANNLSTSNPIGVAQSAINNNSTGLVTSIGIVLNINTTQDIGGTWNAGTILYLDPNNAGGLTATQPTAPNYAVRVATVVYRNATTGRILISKSNAFTLASSVVGTLAIGNGGTGITSFGNGVQTALGNNVSGTGNIVLTTTPSISAASIASSTISNNLTFTPTSSNPSVATGTMWYNNNYDSLSYYNGAGDTINIGQQIQQEVYNTTSKTVSAGQVVYLSSSNGLIPEIQLAQANSLSTANAVGIAAQNIANNSNGYVVILGQIDGLNTSAFNVGDTLYLSPTIAGGITNVQPTVPNYAVRVGFCVASDPLNGAIFVSVRNVYTSASNIIAVNSGTSTVAAPASGALLIGNGSIFTQSTLASGLGIAITNGAGTISIAQNSVGPVYTNTGTAWGSGANTHMVIGTTIVTGSLAITLSGAAAFTSSTSYNVQLTNTQNNTTYVTQTSGTSFTINVQGPGNQTVNYTAIGY